MSADLRSLLIRKTLGGGQHSPSLSSASPVSTEFSSDDRRVLDDHCTVISPVSPSSDSYPVDDRHTQRIVRLRDNKPFSTSSALSPPFDNTAANAFAAPAPATPRRGSVHLLTPTSNERQPHQSRVLVNGPILRFDDAPASAPAAAVNVIHPERALQLAGRESLRPERPESVRHEFEKFDNPRHERPDSRRNSGIDKVICLPNGIEIDRWQPSPPPKVFRESPSSNDVRPKAPASSSSRAVLIDHRTFTGPNGVVTQNKPNKPCRFFGRGPRSCLDGDRCLFLHESPASAVPSRHRSISNDNDRGVIDSPPPIAVKSSRAEFEAAARALEKAALEKAAQEKASSAVSPPADKDDVKPVRLDPDRLDKSEQPEKHKQAELPTAKPLAAEQRTVCVIFQSLGDCPFGSGCPDLHQIATSEPVSVSQPAETSPPALRIRRVSVADVTVVEKVSRPRSVSPVGPPPMHCKRWQQHGKCSFGNKCFYKEGHVTTRFDERAPTTRSDERIAPSVKRMKLIHSSPSPDRSSTRPVGGHVNGIRVPSPPRHRPEKLAAAHDSPRSRLTSRASSPVDERTCGRWEKFGNCHFGDKCYFKNTHYPPGIHSTENAADKKPKRSRSPSPRPLWVRCESPPKRLREESSITPDDTPVHSRHTSSSDSPSKEPFCSRWQRTGSCIYGVNCHYRNAHVAPTPRSAETNPVLKKVQLSRTPSPERGPSSSSSSKLARKNDDLDRSPRKVLVYCRQMEMTGQCQFGKRCWYSHDIPLKRPQKPQIQVVEREVVKGVDEREVDNNRVEGKILDVSNHGPEDMMQVLLDAEKSDGMAFTCDLMHFSITSKCSLDFATAHNNRPSSPSTSERPWDAYAETWGSLELANGSYPRTASDNQRLRPHSGGSYGRASAVEGHSAGKAAADDASNSGSSMAAGSRESTVDGERATAAAIPLTHKYFSLYKGQGVFVATVQLVNVVMTSAVERGLAQELEQDGALCVAHMAPMDHMEGALQTFDNAQPHDHAAIIAVLPSQSESIKTVATYLTIAKKAGVVTLKSFTLFVLPAADAGSLFNIDVDMQALLYCIAVRNTGATPGTLKTSGMSRPLKFASPFLASVELRQTYLQTTHGLPEKFAVSKACRRPLGFHSVAR
ncbi:hypothetical protein BDZ88DRAFT_293218 [Geranomyces variabilis]|nr:hypothetical protein BDZ88DRAFT_293218 [Geranomyces variabilis]